MRREHDQRISCELLVILCLFVLVYAAIGSHREVLGVDIMEARNLITAREMMETGYWLLPTLHGEPRLAKPPLPTWLTAGAMLLGNDGQDTDLAVNRIPSVLAGFLLAASLFGLTRSWSGSTETAVWTTAFLATSYMFVLMARRNTWDIYCHAFMLAAIWGIAVITHSTRPRKLLAVLVGVLIGLSGLSKGPVSYYALLLPFIVSLLTTGGWKVVRDHGQELGVALGIGIIISSMWYMSAWLAMPDDFSRMVSTERTAWRLEHTKPFWFYFQFPAMTGVWTLVACAALWPAHARVRVGALFTYWRPVVWTLCCVGLLILIPEKKDRYLLPVLVPLCQLMGAYVAGLSRDSQQGGRLGRGLILANTMLFGGMCLALPVMLVWLRPQFPALDACDLTGVAGVAVLAAALLYKLYRLRHVAGLFIAKFSILGVCCLVLPSIVQPPAGDMSVPVTTVRAVTALMPVVGDGSLKFQDSWVVGRKPLGLDELAGLDSVERICFVSRADSGILPAVLKDYVVSDRLDVTDLSGQILHVLMLARDVVGQEAGT